jgi:hypothetical protein
MLENLWNRERVATKMIEMKVNRAVYQRDLFLKIYTPM